MGNIFAKGHCENKRNKQRKPVKGLSRYLAKNLALHDSNTFLLALAALGVPKASNLLESEGTDEKAGLFFSLHVSLYSSYLYNSLLLKLFNIGVLISPSSNWPGGSLGQKSHKKAILVWEYYSPLKTSTSPFATRVYKLQILLLIGTITMMSLLSPVADQRPGTISADLVTVSYAFVTLRLDYCNMLFCIL